jgi:hypothetical protein
VPVPVPVPVGGECGDDFIAYVPGFLLGVKTTKDFAIPAHQKLLEIPVNIVNVSWRIVEFRPKHGIYRRAIFL